MNGLVSFVFIFTFLTVRESRSESGVDVPEARRIKYYDYDYYDYNDKNVRILDEVSIPFLLFLLLGALVINLFFNLVVPPLPVPPLSYHPVGSFPPLYPFVSPVGFGNRGNGLGTHVVTGYSRNSRDFKQNLDRRFVNHVQKVVGSEDVKDLLQLIGLLENGDRSSRKKKRKTKRTADTKFGFESSLLSRWFVQLASVFRETLQKMNGLNRRNISTTEFDNCHQNSADCNGFS